ncbi:MAG: 30S ribosomal protein S17 [Candidatus Dormibacteraceae bacterium]
MSEQIEIKERAVRKMRQGRVISNRMEKTVIVEIADSKSHRLYKKVVRSQKHFKAHDENNQCRIGDLVRIVETRPLARTKRWRVSLIVEKAR